MPEHTTEYWLDTDDRILRVSNTWNDFALNNDGIDVVSNRIVGKRLKEYIHGEATWIWLQTVFQYVRLIGKPVERPYRCDSPNTRRFMAMRIGIETDGSLEVSHRIIRTEPISPALRFETVLPPIFPAILRCSICNRIRSAGIWREANPTDTAAKTNPPSALQVAYDVCPECKKQATSNPCLRTVPHD